MRVGLPTEPAFGARLPTRRQPSASRGRTRLEPGPLRPGRRCRARLRPGLRQNKASNKASNKAANKPDPAVAMAFALLLTRG